MMTQDIIERPAHSLIAEGIICFNATDQVFHLESIMRNENIYNEICRRILVGMGGKGNLTSFHSLPGTRHMYLNRFQHVLDFIFYFFAFEILELFVLFGRSNFGRNVYDIY